MKLTIPFPTYFIPLIALLFTSGFSSLYAQGDNIPAREATYFINLNQLEEKVVHEIQHEVLSIQYRDNYAKEQALPLTIYNWKREKVATFSLAKSYGLNYFNINIAAIFNAWEEGSIYSCEFSDESGHVYRLLVKKIPPPEMESPEVNIFVNPLHLGCLDETGSVVEFYGQVEGGKAPYKVNWYVMNDQKTQFLYQPREQFIEKAGQTMVIQVDHDPSYYVLLSVQDACGNEQERMVYLLCQEEEKKINTLFVEPLREFPHSLERTN